MIKIKHIHKYKRIKHGIRKTTREPYIVYRCMLPNCNHFISEEFIVGKQSICYKCNSVFIIDNRQIRDKKAKPHCYCDSKLTLVSNDIERDKDTLERLVDDVFGGLVK